MPDGNYDFSFWFVIPPDVPSSFFFKDKHREEKPSLKIKYTIKAHLDIKGMKDVKYKHNLMIREHPENFQMNQ